MLSQNLNLFFLAKINKILNFNFQYSLKFVSNNFLHLHLPKPHFQVCNSILCLFMAVYEIFWDTNHLYTAIPHVLFFRWFKFTLKPPYSGASERSLLAIWDTSHWNFFVKFGLRTAWDISYDILLSLLKFVNFWRLQGRLSILAKIGCLQKIKVFSMKERLGFNVTWGF